MIILYKCDHEKNTGCNKQMCYYRDHMLPCKGTIHIDEAVKDKNDVPVVQYVRFGGLYVLITEAKRDGRCEENNSGT